MTREREALRVLVLAAKTLDDVLQDAEAYQWSASPTDGAPLAEGGRPVGGPPADPTADAATDPRRLRLRAEVEAAYRVLGQATEAVNVARRRLERALDAWTGAEE